MVLGGTPAFVPINNIGTPSGRQMTQKTQKRRFPQIDRKGVSTTQKDDTLKLTADTHQLPVPTTCGDQ